MACRDYEYRYERYERKPYGECSSYDDKCMVYNDLLNEIKKLDESFTVTDAIKDGILDDWKVSIQRVFENSLLARQIINNVNGNSCVGNRESLDSFFRKEKADFVKADIPLLERV